MQRLQKMCIKNCCLNTWKNVNLRGIIFIETNVLPSGAKYFDMQIFPKNKKRMSVQLTTF